MRISDWSSDVCSSDLMAAGNAAGAILADLNVLVAQRRDLRQMGDTKNLALRTKCAQFASHHFGHRATDAAVDFVEDHGRDAVQTQRGHFDRQTDARELAAGGDLAQRARRSEEHTSELQSLMRISYAVFCLKKKTTQAKHQTNDHNINT